jgi:hypothetical protein
MSSGTTVEASEHVPRVAHDRTRAQRAFTQTRGFVGSRTSPAPRGREQGGAEIGKFRPGNRFRVLA